MDDLLELRRERDLLVVQLKRCCQCRFDGDSRSDKTLLERVAELEIELAQMRVGNG